MLNDIAKSKVPKETITKLAGNSDYDRAMQVITIIESMKNVVQINELDWIYSSIFTDCLERIKYEFSSLNHHFINWKLDELLDNMLKIATDFMNLSGMNFIANGSGREYSINILGQIRVQTLSSTFYTDWGTDDYQECLNSFFESYNEFKKTVQNMRTEIDLLM